MDFDELIKYLIWVVFFALAIAGVFLLLKKIGIL
jgi:hypothetical protein